MWWNLNKVMSNNDVPNPNFKGFMVDNVQANWNAVWIIYGNEDPSEPMVNRKQTFFSLESILGHIHKTTYQAKVAKKK